jgi:hypothetical protein
MDLEVREAILAEELERSLHPSHGWDLSAELDEAHTRMEGIDGQRAAEADRLSWQAMEISGFLVDLGMMPIQLIPHHLKRAQEVLPAVDLTLRCLQEALASSAGPWD